MTHNGQSRTPVHTIPALQVLFYFNSNFKCMSRGVLAAPPPHMWLCHNLCVWPASRCTGSPRLQATTSCLSPTTSLTPLEGAPIYAHPAPSNNSELQSSVHPNASFCPVTKDQAPALVGTFPIVRHRTTSAYVPQCRPESLPGPPSHPRRASAPALSPLTARQQSHPCPT